MENDILKLDKVSSSYGDLQILHDVSLKIDPGEVVALMGPNGAGKSTVLKTIFGLVSMTSGHIEWRGKKIKPVPHEVVERGIAFVPQGRRVFNNLTVEENLEIGGYALHNTKQARERLNELMEAFPILEKKRKAKSGTLSGGQQQLLALSRGLMTKPQLLLLDEPTLGLSPKVVKEIFAAIKEVNMRYRTSIMVVEHNIKSVLDIVDRAYVLDKGKVAAEGKPVELLENKVLEKIFMGQAGH